MSLFSTLVHPKATMVTAAVLAVYYGALTMWVVRWRFIERRAHGLPAEDSSTLLRMARAHGNSAEQIPLLLLLMFLLEVTGAPTGWMSAIGAMVVLGRALHLPGMLAPKTPNLKRMFGMICTVTPLFGMAIWILCRELA